LSGTATKQTRLRPRPEGPVNVGTSITLILVSQPLTKGGFVGQTLTLNVGLDRDAATPLGECATGITSLAFGSVTPSSVTSP